MNKMDASNAWVFISHSNKDFDKLIWIRNKLEALQYRPLLFFLKCLDDEQEIFELIKREIQARDRFILCDSKNSRESEWVKREKEFILSLNRPYEIIDLDGTEEEINRSIERFDMRSTVYVWSTDDKMKKIVAEKLVKKTYKVELLDTKYLRDYYLYKIEKSDLVSDDFHDVMGTGYVAFIISNKLSELEEFYIDRTASLFRQYTNYSFIYITSKEAMANGELYYDLRNADGIQPRIISQLPLIEINYSECADKIVADIIALDNYQHNR